MMATKTLPLEELKGTIVSDLFAYSGSKIVDLNDWINQQWEEIGEFPSDTFHKQGYVVQSMVEVFSKTEKKDKTKALCGLAGRLWFAHRLLYDQNEALKQEFAANNTKLAEVEEDLLNALTEKNVLAQELLQAQRKCANDEAMPKESEEKSGDVHNKIQQLSEELEHAKQELKICYEQIEHLKATTNGHVNSLYELQTQAHEHRRRSEGYQQKIQDLEAAQKKGKTPDPFDCDGSFCKEKIRQLENDRMKAHQEIDFLKSDVAEARDRYWEANNTVRDREMSIENRESKISRLEKERELLQRQVEESRGETRELQNLLLREGNRGGKGRRPSTTEVIRTRGDLSSDDQDDSPGSGREGNTAKKIRKSAYGADQGKHGSSRYHPHSDDGSESEWTEVRRRKTKSRYNDRYRPDRMVTEVPPNGNAKSIKTIRGMLPLFSKSNKGGSIQDHLSLYQRLMQTLGMSSDMELRTYLSWTFAADSQSFFMSVDSKDYRTWTEYRCEVIKHFSPHRNSHEALRHALNLKCESNQHPRDYLQLLKNAFTQVQKEVDTETKQFKDAFFYGLPKHIRTQLARDYNEHRSIDWIYKQAKSIYDVSRTEESNEGKDKPKPSKICEVSREKELPFETGGNKPRPVPKERERKRSPERKIPEGPARETEKPSTISPRYRGNNPIPNFVYRPRENNAETRTGGSREREKPRETERGEREQCRSRERDGNAQGTYRQGGYDRPEYSQYRRDNRDSREWQDQRNSSDNRDRFQRWDERPRSPWRPNRLNALEEQLKGLSQNFQKLLVQGAGSSSRVHAASAAEPTDRDTTHTGQ